MALGGRWGVVRERVRTADERRSVPNTWHLTTGCLKQSQLPPANSPGDRPSIHATANDPGLPRTGRSHADMPRCLGNVNGAATSVDSTRFVCGGVRMATLRCWPPTKLSPRFRRRRLEQGRCWVGKVQIKQCGVVTRSWSCHAVMFIASVGRRRGAHWLYQLFDVQFSSMLPVSIVRCANQPYCSKWAYMPASYSCMQLWRRQSNSYFRLTERFSLVPAGRN